ncbi:SGNH/GDSL hydrolase family protein [Acidicapsa acidisoli]|uniref:SGNH/GDSL hydrolase family protein n=1 Tax=Acidicapsa acidisoli TaxID=1615681 RepID=UPI0021E06683|nr:SGNH/GDSL hydrolase family protein [Acidicapsa acidisoli]
MKQSGHRLLLKFAILAASVFVPCAHSALIAQTPVSKPEEIEWTWEVRPVHPDPKLPNVLLLGDSITRAYFPEVQRQLTGVANVYLMATSASLGDPRLTRQIEEFSSAEAVSFSLIHFNNGMHGWTYSEKEYQSAFPALLTELHTIAPKAALVWATSTPVRTETQPGPTNARVDARNAIAQAAIQPNGIVLDDQHALMAQHSDLYQDAVHFNDQGAAIQGKQAAQIIRERLAKLPAQ